MRARALFALALLAGACSGGGVSQSDFDAVAEERNLAQVRLTESQVARVQLEDQVMTLEMDNDHVLFDLDTPADYQRLLRRLEADKVAATETTGAVVN